MWLLSFAVIALGYFLGSVPFGYLTGKVNGIDIRNHGSHNIGATNVLRVLGKSWGIVVFIADATKGFSAVRLALLLADSTAGHGYRDYYAILAGAACVAGHSFPVWLHFRGGKGVATSAGAILGIMPIAAVIIFLIWFLVFHITRYVSVASIVAACALPVTVALLIRLNLTHAVVLFYFSLGMTTLVVWRHRSNLSRLLKGTEPRFVRK